MKIHEYQAAEIFRKAGLPVPAGVCTTKVEEAQAFAEKHGYPVVLKSQVHVGGRGKAGGIKVVRDAADLKEKYAALLKLTIKGYPVKKIFVVQALDIKKEFYCSIIVDTAKEDVVIISSAEGGVDIEETAKTNPDAIKKYYMEGARQADSARLESYLSGVFGKDRVAEAKQIYEKLIALFFANDCTLAEINPLVIDGKGKIYAADAKMLLDDNALMRHEDLAALRDMDFENAEEVEAKTKDLSFVKLEGNVGCIVNGAGLAMATMDIVKLCGGQPANFLDVGGSSNPQKVLSALQIILKDSAVKAILINIFGGITRCDDIANGIIEARKKMTLNVPLVVRLTGTNEEEAKQILKANGMEIYTTMRDAVNKVVELANA